MESRLIHIEYETSTEKNWKPQDSTISVLSIREKDLKQIIFSSSCGAQVVFTHDDVIKALTQFQKSQPDPFVKGRCDTAQDILRTMANSMKKELIPEEEMEDPWKHRSSGMKCRTCMWFVIKTPYPRGCTSTVDRIGRCRRHSPTTTGYPVCYECDWCGDHKMDENKA